MISVVILTKNEESNIARVLKSVDWSDDVIVFDSYSSDGTVGIAKELGARVVQREFDNWSKHQNWGVQNIDFHNEWVLYLDADEECDEMLKQELLSHVAIKSDFSAFRVRRKDFFLGKWLKHAQLYPTWLIRVFKPNRIRYERLVNPVAIVDGGIGELQGHIIHHPFSHGCTHWFERHNNYSTFESQDLIRENAQSLVFKHIFQRDANVRRKELKKLAYRMPLRPAIMFFYLAFIRLGILDGRPGLYYMAMRSAYELMIDVKVAEYKYRNRGKHT